MINSLLFAPLLPMPVIWVLGALTLAFVLFAAFRGLSGWALRGLAGLVVVAALAGPIYQQEDRDALSDIVLLLEDRTASQSLTVRPAQVDEAIADLTRKIGNPVVNDGL